MKEITIKQLYHNKTKDGTYRILVDRLWPRGVKKIDLNFDEWNKEIAPSTLLRKWFNHQPENFEKFTERYRGELKEKATELDRIREIAKTKPITLLYGAKDPTINQAIVLKNILLQK